MVNRVDSSVFSSGTAAGATFKLDDSVKLKPFDVKSLNVADGSIAQDILRASAKAGSQPSIIPAVGNAVTGFSFAAPSAFKPTTTDSMASSAATVTGALAAWRGGATSLPLAPALPAASPAVTPVATPPMTPIGTGGKTSLGNWASTNLLNSTAQTLGANQPAVTNRVQQIVAKEQGTQVAGFNFFGVNVPTSPKEAVDTARGVYRKVVPQPVREAVSPAVQTVERITGTSDEPKPAAKPAPSTSAPSAPSDPYGAGQALPPTTSAAQEAAKQRASGGASTSAIPTKSSVERQIDKGEGKFFTVGSNRYFLGNPNGAGQRDVVQVDGSGQQIKGTSTRSWAGSNSDDNIKNTLIAQASPAAKPTPNTQTGGSKKPGDIDWANPFGNIQTPQLQMPEVFPKSSGPTLRLGSSENVPSSGSAWNSFVNTLGGVKNTAQWVWNNPGEAANIAGKKVQEGYNFTGGVLRGFAGDSFKLFSQGMLANNSYGGVVAMPITPESARLLQRSNEINRQGSKEVSEGIDRGNDALAKKVGMDPQSVSYQAGRPFGQDAARLTAAAGVTVATGGSVPIWVTYPAANAASSITNDLANGKPINSGKLGVQVVLDGATMAGGGFLNRIAQGGGAKAVAASGAINSLAAWTVFAPKENRTPGQLFGDALSYATIGGLAGYGSSQVTLKKWGIGLAEAGARGEKFLGVIPKDTWTFGIPKQANWSTDTTLSKMDRTRTGLGARETAQAAVTRAAVGMPVNIFNQEVNSLRQRGELKPLDKLDYTQTFGAGLANIARAGAFPAAYRIPESAAATPVGVAWLKMKEQAVPYTFGFATSGSVKFFSDNFLKPKKPEATTQPSPQPSPTK